jgi:hypothetical protein
LTTYIVFQPASEQPFTFRARVGGHQLFCSVPWNHYARRYYLQLKDSLNCVVASVPLIASPDDFDINLALPFAPGTLVFRDSTQQFEAT